MMQKNYLKAKKKGSKFRRHASLRDFSRWLRRKLEFLPSTIGRGFTSRSKFELNLEVMLNITIFIS